MSGSEHIFQLLGETVAQVTTGGRRYAGDLMRTFGASEDSVARVQASEGKIDNLLPELRRSDLSTDDAKRLLYWGIHGAIVSESELSSPAREKVLRVAKGVGLDEDDVERLLYQVRQSLGIGK